MSYVVWALIGYVAGCINGAQIIGKIKGIDIKKNGVQNAGASNTAILLGWKFGLIVALIDIVKAVLPILVLHQIGGENTINLLYITGLFVILGHNYPVNMGFSGGKGTASLIGFLFALDWQIGFICFGLLIVLALTTDYVAMGVFFMYIAFITATVLYNFGAVAIAISVGLTILSIYKHLENYRRIENHTEPKVSSLFKRKI